MNAELGGLASKPLWLPVAVVVLLILPGEILVDKSSVAEKEYTASANQSHHSAKDARD